MISYHDALILTSILNLFAVCRMLLFRVQRRLPFLVTFLSFQLAQVAGVLFLGKSVDSKLYEQVYEFAEPLNWVLYLLIVREMYQRAFADYPGISSFARWSSYASGAVALVMAVVVAILSPIQHWPHSKIFVYVEQWEKFVSFALSAFILFMIFLLSRYPIKLDFNVAASIIIFAIYFAGSFLFLELGGRATRHALEVQTAGLLVLSFLCFGAWGFLLRDSAKRSPVQVRVNLQPQEEGRLLAQLSFIDNMLVKAARH